MFTGLVFERGRLSADPRSAGRGFRMEIAASAALVARLPAGASVSVSGVCLTVVARSAGAFAVEVVEETLGRTGLGGLARGDEVNLEPPLRVGDDLGGHFVQGHVDGLVTLLARRDRGSESEFEVELPARWRSLVVEKGSVALDGVSLTVAGLGPDRFRVAIVPHTLEVTTLGAVRPGHRFHFEADVLAKHVAAALAARGLATNGDEGT